MGAETLEGGAGADVFVFGTDGLQDRITDLQPGADRIDIAAWLIEWAALEITGHDDGTAIIRTLTATGPESLWLDAAWDPVAGQPLFGEADFIF